MQNNYLEKNCQYCGSSFKTVRADAKFCSKKHRMKAHRLTKSHIRLAAMTGLELLKLRKKFSGFDYFEIKVESASFENNNYHNVVMFYVKKEDFLNTVNLADKSTIINTPVGNIGLRSFRLKDL